MISNEIYDIKWNIWYQIKYMISNKIYFYSLKYICIQSKIFVFNEKFFTLYFYFHIQQKNYTRTLFQIVGYQKSYSGYFSSFTNVQLTV